MRCIFFAGKVCKAKGYANPVVDYVPNKQEKEGYCENPKFQTCPRYVAYLDFLKTAQK